MSLLFEKLERLTSIDADIFCSEAFKIENDRCLVSDKISIKISKQVKRCAGNINRDYKTGVFKINVSYDYYKTFGIQRSIGTLRHELAHLVAYKKTGRMDHGPVFKSLCVELGGTMGSDMAGHTYKEAACDQYIRGNIKGYKYVYSCPNCDNRISRTRRISEATKNKSCGACHTKVSLWSEKRVEL